MMTEQQTQQLQTILKDLQNGLEVLSRKLIAQVPPGHVEYVSKKDASEWAQNLSGSCVKKAIDLVCFNPTPHGGGNGE